MAYRDKVLGHRENPRNPDAFDKGDSSLGTGIAWVPDLLLALANPKGLAFAPL
jgi:hypothetical protein